MGDLSSRFAFQRSPAGSSGVDGNPRTDDPAGCRSSPVLAVLISGQPCAGKTTLAEALCSASDRLEMVTIPPGMPRRSTAETRAARIAHALDAMDRGKIPVIDACATTPRTLAYWTRRIPGLVTVRVVVDDAERERRLRERRQSDA